MEDLTPIPQKEPNEEAEDGTSGPMEIDESRQQTPTQPTFDGETRPTKPEESEVEELVKIPSAPVSEAGDQEMGDTAVIKEEEGEKGEIVDGSVKDKEEDEEDEEEDAPVSTRLRRPKKDCAPKEKVEAETTSPKTRKGHKKGEAYRLYV